MASTSPSPSPSPALPVRSATPCFPHRLRPAAGPDATGARVCSRSSRPSRSVGYALLFRIASGQLLGPDTPVRLRLLEIEPALKAAEGTAMELDDCAFPLLHRHRHHRRRQGGLRRRQRRAARRRAPAHRRAWSAATCCRANGGIFKPQGEAINAGAADDVRVLVVGNPANTNALIAASARPRRPGRAASPR